MNLTVLPFFDLKERRNEFDALITVLDPDAYMDPLYGLPTIYRGVEKQTTIRVWCYDTLKGYDYAPEYIHCAYILSRAESFLHTKAKIGIACMKGISRSSATALMLLVAEHKNIEIAYARWRGLKRSEEFWTNDTIIEHADKLLFQNGKMIQKVNEYKAELGLPLYAKKRLAEGRYA